MVEIHYWPPTLERWRKEGLPEDQSPEQYFDLDVISRVALDCSLQFAEETLEETEEWTVRRDRDGSVHKHWKDRYATPAELDHLIKQPTDWERVRERLQPTEDRIPKDLARRVNDAHERGHFVALVPNEPVWWTLRALGFERALTVIGENPAWFAEMVEAQAELQVNLIRRVAQLGIDADAVWYFSDLCYRNGMLFSPRSYRELMLEQHRRLGKVCHELGMFLMLHCDGDCRELIPLLIEAGFDAIQPLEARAGNDVRQLKPLYGDQITFFGNIDMDVFASGDRGRILEEVVTKLEAAMPGGGYIYHSDHSVPPTVAFEDYAFAIQLTRQHGAYTAKTGMR